MQRTAGSNNSSPNALLFVQTKLSKVEFIPNQLCSMSSSYHSRKIMHFDLLTMYNRERSVTNQLTRTVLWF